MFVTVALQQFPEDWHSSSCWSMLHRHSCCSCSAEPFHFLKTCSFRGTCLFVLSARSFLFMSSLSSICDRNLWVVCTLVLKEGKVVMPEFCGNSYTSVSPIIDLIIVSLPSRDGSTTSVLVPSHVRETTSRRTPGWWPSMQSRLVRLWSGGR